MAGPVGKSVIEYILVQATCDARAIRAQRDHLLQLQLQLQQVPAGGDADAAKRLGEEVAAGLIDVSFSDLELGARHLTTCLTMAASRGVAPSLPDSFAVISDEKLYDELVALRLPEPPATQAHAFARCEAAFYAVKLPQEHHLLRCIDHLAKIAPAATGEPPQPQASSGSMDKARTYLDRACTLGNIAVTHADVAVAAISSFLDPKDVASINSFVDHMAII